MADPIIRGECSCRRIRFEAEPPTLFVAHCHCETCRKAHGAGFVTFAGFPEDRFRIVEGEEQLVTWQSEGGGSRHFCATCGSTLLYRGPRYEGEVHVAVGNLLDPLDRAPQAHAFAERSPDWCPITDDLPRVAVGDDSTA